VAAGLGLVAEGAETVVCDAAVVGVVGAPAAVANGEAPDDLAVAARS
jgi:hypothetical protein